MSLNGGLRLVASRPRTCIALSTVVRREGGGVSVVRCGRARGLGSASVVITFYIFFFCVVSKQKPGANTSVCRQTARARQRFINNTTDRIIIFIVIRVSRYAPLRYERCIIMIYVLMDDFYRRTLTGYYPYRRY